MGERGDQREVRTKFISNSLWRRLRDAPPLRFVLRVLVHRGLLPYALGRLEVGEGMSQRTDHFVKTCRHPDVAAVRHGATKGRGGRVKPGAPMLSQALISCSPETEVHQASRAWLLASLMMKQMNSVAHSCTSLFASLEIFAYPISANWLAMILATHAMGNWCGRGWVGVGGWGDDTSISRRPTRGVRLLVQQHLLLSIPGQIERIRLQLLCPLRLFNAVRVRMQTRLLARVVGHAAGQYEALIPLEGHHASHRLWLSTMPGSRVSAGSSLVFAVGCSLQRSTTNHER